MPGSGTSTSWAQEGTRSGLGDQAPTPNTEAPGNLIPGAAAEPRESRSSGIPFRPCSSLPSSGEGKNVYSQGAMCGDGAMIPDLSAGMS